MKPNILLITLFSLCVLSCSKEKSKNWVIIDFEILNTESSLPEEVNLYVGYPYVHHPDIHYPPEHKVKKIKIGKTINGVFYKEVNVESLSKKKSLVLYIESVKLLENTLFNYYADQQVSLNRKKVNTVKTSLKPDFYQINPTIITENCFDQTDTSWIEYAINEKFDNYPLFIFTGCINNLMLDSSKYHFRDQIYFKIKTKRNGVLDSLIIQKTLEPYIINEFDIVY